MRDRLLHGFFLGELRVEPLTGQVSGPGISGHLPSKSVELLLCLASDSRSLVSRDTLLREVWGEGNGSQEALSHTVSELRQILGDHHNDPHFIQTVPTRGYRLLVDPRIASPDDDQVNSDSTATRTEKSSLIQVLIRRGVIQAGVIFLVVGWLLIQIADALVPTLGCRAGYGHILPMRLSAASPSCRYWLGFLNSPRADSIWIGAKIHPLSPWAWRGII